MEKWHSNETVDEPEADPGLGWASLSGYMEYKPTEGICRLMFRRRLYFVLDDFKKALLGFRTQEQARSPEQHPTVTIDLQSSGIYLNSREKCQFTIISHGSEHQLTAESHESSMIWLLALQSLRNRCSHLGPSQPLAASAAATAASFTNPGSPEDDEKVILDGEGCNVVRSSRKSTSHNGPLFQPAPPPPPALSLPTSPPPHHRHSPSPPNPLSSPPSSARLPRRSNPSPPSSRFSSFRRFSATSQRYWYEKYQHQKRINRIFRNKGISLDTGIEFYKRQGLPYHELCFGWEPGDDVFENDVTSVSSERHVIGTMKKAHSDDTHLGDAGFYPLHRSLNSNSFHHRSGRIESADSALEQNNHADLISQLVDLENQLLTSKCEMAKLLNKETCFKEMLDKRDQIIKGLDKKIKEMENEQKSKTSIADLVQNQIRELQDQTQFLSREIRHLSHLRHLDYQHIQHQKRQVTELKACIETWKDNYVYLLQSCITVPTGDATDQWHLRLFGGDTHRYRVQELLAEARLTNPSLPEYSWLFSRMSHVDQYGFRHVFDGEGLLLHHLCQQLHLHYRTLHPEQEPCVRRWTQLLASPVGAPFTATKEMKQLCRRGIPVQFRGDAWKRLVYSQVVDIMEEAGSHYYTHLVTRAHDSLLASCYRKQIYMDLMRTMPTNINFSSENAEGVRRMKEVLQAFSIHNPEVGYCQGLNFITAVCLLFLDTEDAFWALVAITEKFFSPCYFDKGLNGAKVDQEVLKELISQKLPRLHQHLQNFDIELPTVTLNWFLAIFFDVVPFQTLLRVWDCFLLEGPKVLFRFSLAILKSNEDRLLEQTDTISLLRYLKICTKLLFDAEGMVKTAFEELKPFPHKQDIVLKQSHQMELLQEKLRKRTLKFTSKMDLLQQEYLDQELLSSPNALLYDCATVCSEGFVWLFLGCQTLAKVNVLDCRDGFARPVQDAKFDSRVLCAFAVGGIILVSTLSRQLSAYSSRKFRLLWSLSLNDVVLCINSRQQRNDDWMVFAGLGDGTMAVIEYIQTGKRTSDDPLYIQIGRNAVTSVQLVNGNRLWISCGNMVHILNAITLDAVAKVQVATSSQDYVHTMSVAEEGVWLALNGSSVIELWDKTELTCKMLYDVTKCHWISHKKEEDAVNQRRIASLLPVGSSLWIGRGDGTLMVFGVSSTLFKPHSPLTAIVDLSPMADPNGAVEFRCGTAKTSQLSPPKGSPEEENSPGSRDTDEATNNLGHRRTMANIRQVGRKYEDGENVTLKSDPDTTSTTQGVTSKDRKRTSRRLCHIQSSDHRRSSSEPFHRMSLTSEKKGREVISGQADASDDACADDRKSTGKSGSDERRRSQGRATRVSSLLRKGSLHDLVVYPVTLALQSTLKISERPVRCLVQLNESEHGAPIVVSCSGCYGDDDAVLLWKKRPDEDAWSNAPVYEISPDVNQQRRYSHMDNGQRASQRLSTSSRRKTEIF